MLADGLVGPTDEGTPQGGPLSPLLSNLMLDVLDKELERRGHRFARYADDCNIYVCSQRAGERVMASVERFLKKRLKLKINRAKSAVAPPSQRKFLGFSFTRGATPKRRIAPQALARFKQRVREATKRTRGARASKRSPRTCRAISWDGAATSASARRLRRCARSTHGSGAGFDPSCGSNGNAGQPAMRSCAAGAWDAIWRRKPPAALTAPGGSATAPRER